MMTVSTPLDEEDLQSQKKLDTDESFPNATIGSDQSEQFNKNNNEEPIVKKAKHPRPCHINGPFPGDDDFDDNNAPVPFVVNEWAQGTSIHGVPFVTDAATWKMWKRSVWVGLVLISAGFMIWQITQLVRQYRDYEVITDTQTINPAYLDFPEITLCNANAFSKSRMNQTGITNPTNLEEMEQILTPLEEFINATWFNGIPLNVNEVWKPVLMNEIVGRCWRFTTDLHVRAPGFYGGLKVWGDLQQFDYDPLAEFACAFVYVEQPGTFLDAQSSGQAIKPGKETFVNIKMSRFERERQAPWARCRGDAPAYTQIRCRAECWFHYVREHCGCRVYGDFLEEAQVFPFCRRFGDDAKDKACVDQTWVEVEKVLDGCDCSLPACSQTDYESFMVEAEPAISWLAAFDYDGWGITPQYLKDNFFSVTVNYGKIQYSKFTETKAVSFAQLLGSIGGSMGLFLGISLLSIFELVGDLGLMRLVPRWFGHKHLYGVGARCKQD